MHVLLVHGGSCQRPCCAVGDAASAATDDPSLCRVAMVLFAGNASKAFGRVWVRLLGGYYRLKYFCPARRVTSTVAAPSNGIGFAMMVKRENTRSRDALLPALVQSQSFG